MSHGLIDMYEGFYRLEPPAIDGTKDRRLPLSSRRWFRNPENFCTRLVMTSPTVAPVELTDDAPEVYDLSGVGIWTVISDVIMIVFNI